MIDLQGMSPVAPALLVVALVCRVLLGQYHPLFYGPMITGYVLAALTVEPPDLRLFFWVLATGSIIIMLVQRWLRHRSTARAAPPVEQSPV